MKSKELSKIEWRVYFNNQIALFLKEERQAEIRAKWRSVLSDFFKNRKGIWGFFYPLLSEPPIRDFLEENQNQNLAFAFPKVENQDLFFYQAENFESHPLGMKEPKDGTLVDPIQMSGVFVPGLGFNYQGQRLGKGKGFYDRFLVNFNGLKIGTCFEVQYTNKEFPVDPWDISMDFVLTENGLKKMERN